MEFSLSYTKHLEIIFKSIPSHPKKIHEKS